MVILGEQLETIGLQALGEDVSSIYVEEFGKVISRDEIYEINVHDFM